MSGATDGRSLDNDIQYLEFLCRNGEREWTRWEAVYCIDGGIPEPYQSLIGLSDSDLTVRESMEGGACELLGEVQSCHRAFVDRPELSLSAIAPDAPADVSPPGNDGGAVRLAARVRGLSRIVLALDVGLVGEELRECPSATLPNCRMLEGRERYLSVAKEIAGRMLNQLFAIHSARRVVSPRRGQVSAPSYNSTLERLWASYADGLASVRTAVCAHCGRLFIPRRKGTQIYCDYDGLNPCQKRHNEQLKQERRHARSEVIKVVRSMGDEPFDAVGIYYLLRGRVRLEMIPPVLEKMAREDDGAVVRIGTARDGGQPVYLRR